MRFLNQPLPALLYPLTSNFVYAYYKYIVKSLLRKTVQAAPVAAFLTIASSSIAYAADVVKIDPCSTTDQGQFRPVCNLSAAKFGALLGNIINLIFIIAIIAALFYLIYGGIKWLTSEGDKSSVEAARQHIIAAIVGLIIVFMSYFILNVVVTFFTGTGLGNIQLPSLQNIQ